MKRAVKTVLIISAALAIIAAVSITYLYTHGLSGLRNNQQAKSGQVKVACVGDSITYGHGISGWPKNTYPSVLQELLGDGYCVNNFGVSGSAVGKASDKPYRSRSAWQDSLSFDADIVVFMMGSNDTKPQNYKDAETFKAELGELLDSYGEAEIYLCTPATAFFPDGKTSGETKYNIQPLVADELAQATREVARERGITLIDIHALTAEHPEWFAADFVHPDAQGAAAIAQEIYNEIAEQ